MQSWSRSILKGILSYAQEVGPWHVWFSTDFNQQQKDSPPKWQGHGVIACVRPENEQFFNELNLPIVNVSDDPYPTFKAPRVQTDDRVGTRLAVQHLIERGLRNIGYIGPKDPSNAERYCKLYNEAASELGHVCHNFQFEHENPAYSQQLKQWLINTPKPIGLTVWGHGYAREVMALCLESQISVPHDIAVLSGSYDELFSHACFPSLSGILLPTESIGYQAARTLDLMMKEQDHGAPETLIPPKGVVARLSTDTLAIEDPKLIKVINFIRAHAFESITMDDILREVPMARRSLERRFRQTFNHSPVDEIRRLRIDKARKLLAETDLQMQEIAESCGYATYNYLTHVFKKTTGMTPRKYRNQFRS